MDTTFFFKADEDVMEGINAYLEGDSLELKEINDFVEYTRYVKEIHQWYEIFDFSLSKLKEVTDGHRGSIEINAYLINLLAAGKNISENMEICLKLVYGEDSSEFESFRKDYSSYEYDHNFSYKFLYKLRNFSQHGHIPVSVFGNDARFDVRQIYYTQHYRFNEGLKKEVEQFMEFVEKHNPDSVDGPYIDLRFTVSSYTVSLYRIYKRFLDVMASAIFDVRKAVLSYVGENKDLINHNKEEYKNLLFYIINDQYPNHLQVINISEDTEKMLSSYKNQVVQSLKDEKDTLKNISKHCIIIKE